MSPKRMHVYALALLLASPAAAPAGVLPSPVISACWQRDPDASLTMAQWLAETDAIEVISQQWASASDVTYVWSKSCAPPDASGRYSEVLRVLLDEDPIEPDGSLIPGCTSTNTGASFATFPDQLASQAKCRYNSVMQRGEAPNKYLHELGHGLGFFHEHERIDNPCVLLDEMGNSLNSDISTELLTPFDSSSVMHYTDFRARTDPAASCSAVLPDGDVEGDQGSYGLSFLDQLEGEIAYPRSTSHMVAGAGIYRTDTPVTLVLEHVARGALTGASFAYTNFSWRDFLMPAIVLSTQPRFKRSVTSPGQYVFTLNFSDAYGRARATAGAVTVLTPEAHTGLFSSAGPALL